MLPGCAETGIVADLGSLAGTNMHNHPDQLDRVGRVAPVYELHRPPAGSAPGKLSGPLCVENII